MLKTYDCATPTLGAVKQTTDQVLFIKKLAKNYQWSSDVEWYLTHCDRTHPNKPGNIQIVSDSAGCFQGAGQLANASGFQR